MQFKFKLEIANYVLQHVCETLDHGQPQRERSFELLIWNSECEENCPENKTPFVKTAATRNAARRIVNRR